MVLSSYFRSSSLIISLIGFVFRNLFNAFIIHFWHIFMLIILMLIMI